VLLQVKELLARSSQPPRFQSCSLADRAVLCRSLYAVLSELAVHGKVSIEVWFCRPHRQVECTTKLERRQRSIAHRHVDWSYPWPGRPDFVAIDGKTSRRSHDRSVGRAPLHLVSAFATTSRLVLGQEAVANKSNETTAIPVLLQRLGANDGLKGTLVSIDAIATCSL
jgi:hypothetical protein